MQAKFHSSDSDEPFSLVCELCREANTPGYRFLLNTLQQYQNIDPLGKVVTSIREKQNASKYQTYRTILNPTLSVHQVYTDKIFIPDYKRQAFTRLRVMHVPQPESGDRQMEQDTTRDEVMHM